MKAFTKALVLAVLFLASLAIDSAAEANDSAYARIRVQGVAPGRKRDGDKIRFYGRNANDFFNMLPPVAISDPGESKEQAQVWRFLAVQSRGWSVNISYAKNQLVPDSVDPTTPTTECTIEMDRPDTESLAFDYHPQCDFE